MTRNISIQTHSSLVLLFSPFLSLPLYTNIVNFYRDPATHTHYLITTTRVYHCGPDKVAQVSYTIHHHHHHHHHHQCVIMYRCGFPIAVDIQISIHPSVRSLRTHYVAGFSSVCVPFMNGGGGKLRFPSCGGGFVCRNDCFFIYLILLTRCVESARALITAAAVVDDNVFNRFKCTLL